MPNGDIFTLIPCCECGRGYPLREMADVSYHKDGVEVMRFMCQRCHMDVVNEAIMHLSDWG
jgi:hypothetical protein